MVAYADVGGMGTKQGPAVYYDWVAPSPGVQVLPWLAILVLLLLKPNRCGSAWWIWLPLACSGAVTLFPHSMMNVLPSSVYDILLDCFSALSFGVAAVWLLAAYLGWKHRMLALLGIVVAQGGFSWLTCLLQQGRDMQSMVMVMGIPLAVSAGVISVALTLAGLACRGRCGWLRLSLWVVAVVVVLWLLIIGPFFIVMAVSRGGIPVLSLFGVVGVAAGITFGALLPFLVLSFANGFYRERLKGLLHLGAAAPPPLITPPMPAVPAAA